MTIQQSNRRYEGKFDWTEDEIRSRIGASTMALLYGKFNEPLGARHIARWRELGITKIELFNSYD